MVIKVDINQAPPVVGVTDANVNRPFIKLAPAVRSLSQSQSIGKVDYNGAADQVPAPVREQLLVPELVHVRQVDGLRVGQRGRASPTRTISQYNWGPSDYDIRHTFASSWIYEIPWARTELYGGWQIGGILYVARRPAVDGHAVPGRALDRHRQPAEPDLRRFALEPDDR